MVKINPGAFFPLETFSQLDVESIRQLVEDVDVESMQQELTLAIAENDFGRQSFANLIVHLLAFDRDEEALDVTDRLNAAIAGRTTESGVSNWESFSWQQLLHGVTPFAVALEKWEYFNYITTQDQSDSLVLCDLLTVAGQVCIAKEWYVRAKRLLQEAKVVALIDPDTICTGAIDRLNEFADLKMRGESVSLQEFWMPEPPQDTDVSKQSDSNWLTAMANEENPNSDPKKDDPYCDEPDEQGRILRKWQLRFAGNSVGSPWREADDLAYLFQCFRPDGDGLDEFCSDLACSDEMLHRLQEIFRITKDGYRTETALDVYFVVHKPVASSDEELTTLTAIYLDSLVKIARTSEYAELATYFQTPPTLSVKRGTFQAGPDNNDIQLDVYDMLNDYSRRFPIPNPNIQILREALYTMACDYNLAHFVVWPEAVVHDHEDPYSKYFELWKRGAQVSFQELDGVIVYVNDAPARAEEPTGE